MTVVKQLRCDTCGQSQDITREAYGGCTVMDNDGVDALGAMRHICPTCKENRERKRWEEYKREIINELKGQS